MTIKLGYPAQIEHYQIKRDSNLISYKNITSNYLRDDNFWRPNLRPCTLNTHNWVTRIYKTPKQITDIQVPIRGTQKSAAQQLIIYDIISTYKLFLYIYIYIFVYKGGVLKQGLSYSFKSFCGKLFSSAACIDGSLISNNELTSSSWGFLSDFKTSMTSSQASRHCRRKNHNFASNVRTNQSWHWYHKVHLKSSCQYCKSDFCSVTITLCLAIRVIWSLRSILALCEIELWL